MLENGYNFSNTFFALDLEVSPTCLSITFDHNGLNTFVSPYFNCVTAVNATASNGNILINPNYGGATVNFGPSSTGVTVIGSGSRSRWYFPSTASYTAAPIDDGLNISSYNAPGASLTVTLPAVGSVNPGWTMGFATDNGKGMTITAPSGAILAGGKAMSSMILGPGNYENLRCSRTATIGASSPRHATRVWSTALIRRPGRATGSTRRPRAMPRHWRTMAISCRASTRPLG